MTNIICGIIREKRIFYFSFDMDSNILTIQPKRMKKSLGIFDTAFEDYPYLKNMINLEGETNSHTFISFINVKLRSIGRNCFQAWVPFYIVGLNGGFDSIPKPNKIKKIVFSSEALDLFIQSNRIVKDDININEKKVSINFEYGNDKLKSFKYNGFNYEFYPSWTRSYSNDINNILVMRSSLCVSSSKNMKLNDILNNYENVKKLLCFVNYRKNVIFDNIILIQDEEVELINEIHRTSIKFELHIASMEKNNDIPNNQNVILIDEILNNIDKIFCNIIEDDFLMQTLPINEKEKRIIDINKYINMACSFESEMNKLIPNFKSKTNSNYKLVKNNIINYIKLEIKKQKSKNSKGTKYYEKFLKEIEIIDGRLDEKIIYAFKKYSYLLEADIKYYEKKHQIKKIDLNQLAQSFSTKRNDLAHGNKLEKFNDNEIFTYVLLRKICYALLIERSGVSEVIIKKIIDKIFLY